MNCQLLPRTSSNCKFSSDTGLAIFLIIFRRLIELLLMCVWPCRVHTSAFIDYLLRFSAPYSTGHFMAFFVSKFVGGPSLETSTRFIRLRPDVYSYNFPRDPRYLKCIGSSLSDYSVL